MRTAQMLALAFTMLAFVGLWGMALRGRHRVHQPALEAPSYVCDDRPGQACCVTFTDGGVVPADCSWPK